MAHEDDKDYPESRVDHSQEKAAGTVAKTHADKQVVKEEHAAEVEYLEYMRLARLALKKLWDDRALSDGKREAARLADDKLRVVEEARVAAAKMPDKKSAVTKFMDWLMGAP